MSCSSDIIFRAGWTERIIFQLSHDGVTFDITGMTVALVGRDTLDQPLVFLGPVGIESPADSKVYFDPVVSDLSASNSPYYLRWSVTDSSGKTAYFPRSPKPMVWIIQNP